MASPQNCRLAKPDPTRRGNPQVRLGLAPPQIFFNSARLELLSFSAPLAQARLGFWGCLFRGPRSLICSDLIRRGSVILAFSCRHLDTLRPETWADKGDASVRQKLSPTLGDLLSKLFLQIFSRNHSLLQPRLSFCFLALLFSNQSTSLRYPRLSLCRDWIQSSFSLLQPLRMIYHPTISIDFTQHAIHPLSCRLNATLFFRRGVFLSS